jgi:hypothetical protein
LPAKIRIELNQYPPAIKHRNGKSTIHRWLSHCNLHVYLFIGDFSLPRLITRAKIMMIESEIWSEAPNMAILSPCTECSTYLSVFVGGWWIFHEVSKCTTKIVWGTGHCSSCSAVS